MNKKKTKKIIIEAYSKEDPMSPNVGYELPEETFRIVLTYRRGEIMLNEVLIDEVQRPALSAGGVDTFTVNWDLTPPKLPAKYANFNHFCVIAQIKTVECNTTNNQAQNNFVNVPAKMGGPSPPPLRFGIANPWRQEAVARLIIKTEDDRLQLEALNFNPANISN